MLGPPGAVDHPASEGDLPSPEPLICGGDRSPARVYVRAHGPARAPESTLDGVRGARRGAELAAQELLEEAAERISRVVPNDGYFFAATDPETTLGDGCRRHQEPPVRDVPDALGLRVPGPGLPQVRRHRAGPAPGGRPSRRHRRPAGALAALARVRSAIPASVSRCAWPSRVDGATWGVGQLNRLGGLAALLRRGEGVARARGARHRAGAAPGAPGAGRGRDGGPRAGAVLVDADGSVAIGQP